MVYNVYRRNSHLTKWHILCLNNGRCFKNKNKNGVDGSKNVKNSKNHPCYFLKEVKR